MPISSSNSFWQGTSFKIYLLVALVLIALGLWAYGNFFIEKVESKQLVGQILEQRDGRIVINGDYIVEDTGSHTPPPPKQTVTVEISRKTKLVKTTVQVPSAAELQASGGAYNGDALPRQILEGSVADLKQGMTVLVLTSKNSFGSDRVTASEVQYTMPIYPD
jgi:hypothetical protein